MFQQRGSTVLIPQISAIRDQHLGANVASAQGPTGLGKYLMRSPTGEIIFGGDTRRKLVS